MWYPVIPMPHTRYGVPTAGLPRHRLPGIATWPIPYPPSYVTGYPCYIQPQIGNSILIVADSADEHGHSHPVYQDGSDSHQFYSWLDSVQPYPSAGERIGSSYCNTWSRMRTSISSRTFQPIGKTSGPPSEYRPLASQHVILLRGPEYYVNASQWDWGGME